MGDWKITPGEASPGEPKVVEGSTGAPPYFPLGTDGRQRRHTACCYPGGLRHTRAHTYAARVYEPLGTVSVGGVPFIASLT